jgi:hypothetical protein
MAKKPENTKATANEAVDAETGEIVRGALSISQQALSGVVTLPDGRKVTVVKQVTVPVLKHKEGETVMITVLDVMYIGKELKASADGTKSKPATLVKVTDIKTNRPGLYIVPAIVADTWSTEYAGDAYVGKSFAIEKLPARDGKRYKDINMLEIGVS